jgi:hypothetical protein
MSVVNNTLLLTGDDGYQISRSVRTRQPAGGSFRRVPASAGNAQKFTISMWKKLGSTGGYLAAANLDTLYASFSEIDLTTAGNISLRSGTLGVSYAWVLTSVQLFRDPSAWYHIVIAYDTTQATSTERCKVWVNNQLVTFTGSYPAQNYSTAFNTTAPQYLAVADGYTAEIHYVDGQQLAPSNFGEVSAVTGVWQAKKYLGTYGTNGAYLNFSDNSAATAAAIGADSSGNGNNWTPNNISVTAGATYDSMLDVPTMWADGGNGRGNYGLLNPLDKTLTDGSITNGNLTLNGTSNWNACRGTFGMSSGKWYWETTHSVYDQSLCGIADSVWPTSTYYPGYSSTGYSAAYGQNALKYVDGVNSAYGATFTIGDVIGYALDMDAGTLTCYKNGVSQGEMVTGLTAYGTIFPAIAAANGAVINANFGQRPFAYTPPTGFKALNTQNLPEPTIKRGNQYFDVSLYTGTGSAQTIVNGGGFQPDLVWQKGRGEVASLRLIDSVRGVDKVIYSNLTNAEATEDGVVDSFNSNGYTGGGANVVTSGFAGVGWQWKASGSTVTNTDGSTTSTVSANPTAGFSIVTFTATGTTAEVGHGLGVVPNMIVLKRRNSADNWFVNHSGFATRTNNWLALNTTGAISTASTTFTGFSSTTMSFGGGLMVNTGTYVAYCFAEVAGYSKFGSYTGNGSADGPFVFCGFRPALVMYKRTDSTANWLMLDTALNPSNNSSTYLIPNSSSSEGTDNVFDILSNGFKLRNGGAAGNASGGTYIFMAFAEHPFQSALAR